MTGLGAVSTIRLRTPAAWIDLELDPGKRAASIASVVERRAEGDRERVRAMLEAAGADAAGQGAVFASLYSDTVAGKAVSASLVVAVVDAEPDDEPGPEPSESAALGLAIAQGLAADFRDGGADGQVRALDAGPAARVRSRQRIGDGERESPVDVLQYFVPFPQGDRLAVLTFSTPNVGLADAFAEVFDAIAGTLQWPS